MAESQKQKGIAITAMLAKMCSYFRVEPLEDEILADYIMALLPYSAENLKTAGAQIMTEAKWFPKIVEFRERLTAMPVPALPAPPVEEKTPEQISYGNAHIRMIKAMIAKTINPPDSRKDPIGFERARVRWLMDQGIAPEYICKVERTRKGWGDYGREVINQITGGDK